MVNQKLEMKFDPRTIEHLGISLYSKLPTVISELISNSWDADAENVSMHFIDNNDKKIIYKDDGNGMTFDELNEKFLLIGRNRRSNEADATLKGRKVIGKKGLGKLSVFGICKTVEVVTIKEGIKNQFIMDIDAILSHTDGLYSPEIIVQNEATKETSGTMISLKSIKRKSPFDTEKIAVSLSKKFLIFDKFNVEIKHNDENQLKITNELKFSDFNPQWEWNFPSSEFNVEYGNWNNISGKIISLTTPVKDPEMKGIYLTSRGKIVNTASYYGLRDNDQFHEYISGYLEVDFIEDFDEDVISTDRQSLNWETDETQELQKYLQIAIKEIARQWRNKRASEKAKKIKEDTGIDISDFHDNLPSYEQELSKKIIDPVLADANLSTEKASNIIEGVIGKFNNEDFKKYADHIANISSEAEIPRLLELMDDWKIIETKQFSDLAQTRIAVIDQFEELIDSDAKEVPTLHNFLKKFSWLLDPRILEFRDEVKYSSLLSEHYPDESLEESDRRIDFLCTNAMGGVLYVIEIKRGKYKIDQKAIEQAYEYGVFLKDRYATPSGFSQVVCFIVGGEKSQNSVFKAKERTYHQSGEVFVKTYTELLEQAKCFHQEFIDKQKEFNS